MSWGKNTWNLSTINHLVGLLDELEIPYKMKVIKKVFGRGNNDNDEPYLLKRLEVKDTIYIDQFIKTTDCDTDDTVITHKFNKKINSIPKDFKVEVTIENS